MSTEWQAHTNPSALPQHNLKPDVAVHTYNPSTLGQEGQISRSTLSTDWGWGQPGLQNKEKNKERESKEGHEGMGWCNREFRNQASDDLTQGRHLKQSHTARLNLHLLVTVRKTGPFVPLKAKAICYTAAGNQLAGNPENKWKKSKIKKARAQSCSPLREHVVQLRAWRLPRKHNWYSLPTFTVGKSCIILLQN